MKGEPRWGRRSVLQLNWVFDEYSATPEVWNAVFRPIGVESMPVLGRRGKVLTTVVQMVIDERVPVDVDRRSALQVAPVRGGAALHLEPEALVQAESAVGVLRIDAEHRLVEPDLAGLDHARPR